MKFRKLSQIGIEGVEGTAIFIKNGTVKDTGLDSASTATADTSSSSSATTTSTTSSPFFGMVYYAIVDASDVKVRWRKQFIEVLTCDFNYTPHYFHCNLFNLFPSQSPPLFPTSFQFFTLHLEPSLSTSTV